jgi:hypothetical protein
MGLFNRKDKNMEDAMNFGMKKGQEAKQDPKEFYKILGSLMDSMIPPLSPDKSEKINCPEFAETKLALAILASFKDDIPIDLRKGFLKVGIGTAYKIETEEGLRIKFKNTMHRIGEYCK